MPDALDYVYDKYIARDPEALVKLEFARTRAQMSRQIYDLRTKAGPTQAHLAKRVGTTAEARGTPPIQGTRSPFNPSAD